MYQSVNLYHIMVSFYVRCCVFLEYKSHVFGDHFLIAHITLMLHGRNISISISSANLFILFFTIGSME